MAGVDETSAARIERMRGAVRELLTGAPDFGRLPADTRRELARGLVKICAAADLLQHEGHAAERARLAQAQSAGSEFSGVATKRLAETTQQVLNAVSFPRFVTELINGVFKAIVDSNQQQLDSFVELVRNIATTTEGFADGNVGIDGARRWLAERFPGSFVVAGAEEDFPGEGEELSAEEKAEAAAERAASTRLRLRPGAQMPTEAALRTALGLGPQDSVAGGDPETLVPLARVALARNRQQMLSTMVMLGLQRIVIESGRLHASMRFHIDTRSAAQEDRGSQFDARHTSTMSGSFGFGPWGASAAMTNTIGYVSTQKTQTTEEMNTDLNLDSSVELVFKTDYLPLERLAGKEQVDRIKVNTLNPEAERKADAEARAAREKRIESDTAARRAALAPSGVPAQPAPPKAGEPGSAEAAEKARLESAKKGDGTKKGAGTTPGAQKTADRPAEGASGEGAKGEGAKGESAKTAGAKPAEADQPAGNSGEKAAAKPADKSAEKAAGKTPPAAKQQALDEPPARKPDVIFVPTPPEAIDTMLALAAPRPGELLVDLGCGDGRIVVAAARRCGCRAIGIDIDPERVREARERIARERAQPLARVEQRDLFDVDLREADVVTLYLLPQLNGRLLPQLMGLKHGARVVSHDFDIAGVIPDRVVQDYLPRLNLYKTYFLYTAPLRPQQQRVMREWRESKGVYDVT